MRLARYFPAVAGAVALAGCGGSGLDTEQLEREIAPDVERKTATRDIEVDCPDDVDEKEGDTFDCDLTAPGGVAAKVRVHQVDGDGGVSWEVVER